MQRHRLFSNPCRGGEDGAANRRFVLLAPLLLVLVFGVVQLGIFVLRTQVVAPAEQTGTCTVHASVNC